MTREIQLTLDSYKKSIKTQPVDYEQEKLKKIKMNQKICLLRTCALRMSFKFRQSKEIAMAASSSGATSQPRTQFGFLAQPSDQTRASLISIDPRLERPYSGRKREEPRFVAVAAKVKGAAIGTLYEKSSSKPGKTPTRYLGKVGIGRGVLADDPRTWRTHRKAEMNLEVIYEKISYDFYRILGEGRFKTPKTYLSRQPIIDQFTRTNRLALYLVGTPDQLQEAGLSPADALPTEERVSNESLRIMSFFIPGYQDFEHGRTLSPEGVNVSFIEYLEATHRPPESLLTPEGKKVPLKGVMAILAVGRVIADTDIIGGSGGNAGFVWVRDQAGEIVAAQAVKIDPGMAFNFGEEDPSNWAANTHHRRRVGTTLADIKDLQIAQQYGPITVRWEAMTSAQKTEFLLTFYHASRVVHSNELVHYLFHRDGWFDRGETEQNPEVVANKFQQRLINWLKIQNQIYGKEMVTNKEFYLAFIRSDFKNYKLIDSPNEELLLDREFLLQWIEELQQSLGAHRARHGEEPHLDVADNFLSIGRAHSHLNEHARAIGYFQRSLELYREIHGDHPHDNIADTLTRLGLANQKLYNYEEGIRCLEQSLEVYRQVYKNRPDSKIAHSLVLLGSSYLNLDRKDRALEYFIEALDMFRKIHNNRPHQDNANTLLLMGLSRQLLGRYQDGIEYFQQSLAIIRELDGEYSISLKAEILNNMGLSYQFLEDYRQAIYYFEQALSVCGQGYDNRPNKEVAKNLKDLGCVHSVLGNHDEAIKCLEQSLGVYSQIHGSDLENVSDALKKLGNAFRKAGDLSRSLDCLRESLAIQKQIRGDQPHKDVAIILNSLGATYCEMEKPFEGRERCKEALAIFKQVYRDQPHPWIGVTLKEIGIAYQRSLSFESSIECFEQALTIYQEGQLAIHEDPSRDRASDSTQKLLILLGTSYKELKDYARGIDYYKQALQHTDTRGIQPSRRLTAIALQGLGSVYSSLNRHSEAIENFEASRSFYLLRETSEGIIAKLETERWIIDDCRQAAATFKGLQLSYFEIENYQRSIKSGEIAEKILAPLINHPSYKDCREELADSLFRMGFAYLRSNNSKSAIQYLEKSKLVYRRIDNTCIVETHMANISGLIGLAYLALHQPVKATEHFQESLIIGKRVFGDKSEEVAQTFLALGICLIEGCRYSQAFDNLRQALAIYRELYSEQPHEKVAETLFKLGLSLAYQLDDVQAIEKFEQALLIQKKIFGDQPHEKIADTFEALGKSYKALNDSGAAIRNFQEALKIRTALYGVDDLRTVSVKRDLEGLQSSCSLQ